MKHQLNDLSVFVEVAKARGFRAAAKKLNLGAGSVSEAVQRFEDRLGVRLFERSTRSVALTPTGERLFERAHPALMDLEQALAEVDDVREEVAGVLRLSAPHSAGPFFLNDLLARFADAYPDVVIELFYNDEKVDMVTGDVDAVIRDQTLVELDSYAVPVGPELEMALVASPVYLASAGRLKTPNDIVNHDGICYAFGRSDRLAPWQFRGKEGLYSVAPRPRIMANDLPSLVQLAEAGLGLAYVYGELVRKAVAEQRLVLLFEKKIPNLPPYSLNYRSKRNMPRQLRALVDFVKAE